jgi:hypothetical protein
LHTTAYPSSRVTFLCVLVTHLRAENITTVVPRNAIVNHQMPIFMAFSQPFPVTFLSPISHAFVNFMRTIFRNVLVVCGSVPPEALRWLGIIQGLTTEGIDGVRFTEEEVQAILGRNGAKVFCL